MSQHLKEINDKIKVAKSRRRVLREAMKDGLTASKSYQEALEDLARAKEKVSRIKAAIMNDFQRDVEEIARINCDIGANQELLSDLAISELMKGETVEIDEPGEDTKLEPVYKVAFKKKR